MAAPDRAWTTLDWDSAFFGFPVARVHQPVVSLAEAEALCEEMQREGIALCYMPASSSDSLSGTSQARAIFLDTRCAYERDVVPGEDAAYTKTVARLTGKDATSAALLRLALESGRYSRFRMDPKFPREKCEALYTQWIVGTLTGEGPDDIAFGAYADAQLVGLITAHADAECAVIGLVAVDADFRGRGLGGQLLHAVECWARDQDLTRIRVVTQAVNEPARRLYVRCGYTLVSETMLLHVWLA